MSLDIKHIGLILDCHAPIVGIELVFQVLAISAVAAVNKLANKTHWETQKYSIIQLRQHPLLILLYIDCQGFKQSQRS